jgi:hypothetical protein
MFVGNSFQATDQHIRGDLFGSQYSLDRKVEEECGIVVKMQTVE